PDHVHAARERVLPRRPPADVQLDLHDRGLAAKPHLGSRSFREEVDAQPPIEDLLAVLADPVAAAAVIRTRMTGLTVAVRGHIERQRVSRPHGRWLDVAEVSRTG